MGEPEVVATRAQRVLVAHASKGGSTAEIAETIGDALRAEGVAVDVRRAAEVADVAPYDAVVLGSALYMARWQRAARRFAARHARALRQRAVWMFSSGPLDDSAEHDDIPPTKRVRAVADRLGARGHVTFGGRLAADADGLIARKMAENGTAGDYRDFARVREWARGVAAEMDRIDAK